MIEMTLKEISEAVGGTLYGDGNILVKGVCTDSRVYNSGEIFIALIGERFDGNDFVTQLKDKCECFITSRRFNGLNHILVKDTLVAFSKLAAFWKMKVSPEYTVGVTGSVGKTTTKELISCVLGTKYKTHSTKGNFNNAYGIPITLIKIEKGTKAVVCEMGMNNKGEISSLTKIVSPNIAVITNIGTSHIENLGSREEICRAKLEILEGMPENGTVILDGDEPLFKTEWASKLLEGKNVLFAGLNTNCDIYPSDIYKGKDYISFDAIYKGGEVRIKVPAVGDHFIKNSLFAVAVGYICKMNKEDIREGILNYAPTGLRQKIYLKNGIKVIADCYNASPESMKASLKVLGEVSQSRKIAVLGDMLELGSYSDEAHKLVGTMCFENKVDKVFTFGKNAYKIMLGATESGMKKDSVSNCIDKNEIAEEIKSFIKPGDTILFKGSRKMKLEDVISLCGLKE